MGFVSREAPTHVGIYIYNIERHVEDVPIAINDYTLRARPSKRNDDNFCSCSGEPKLERVASGIVHSRAMGRKNQCSTSRVCELSIIKARIRRDVAASTSHVNIRGLDTTQHCMFCLKVSDRRGDPLVIWIFMCLRYLKIVYIQTNEAKMPTLRAPMLGLEYLFGC